MSILDWYEKREEFRKKFYEEKRYLSVIDSITGTCLDNDDYEGNWTDEIDEMFDFLFDNAYKIMPFEEEVVIKYKDKLISLFEIHGQGCFRRISEVEDEPKFHVNFEDIVKYYELNEKPYKSYVLEIINRALNAFEVMLDSDTIDLDGQKVNLNDIRIYIEENLK